jgi:hypothetical protein
MNSPTTFSEIIDLLAKHGLLAPLDINPNHARTMKARDSIPAERDCDIVASARKKRLPITFELLARLRAKKRRVSQLAETRS